MWNVALANKVQVKLKKTTKIKRDKNENKLNKLKTK